MSDRLLYIIDNVVDEALKGYSTKDIKFFGLCRQEEKNKEIRPVSYRGNGEFNPAGFTDKYAMCVYHRLISESNVNDVNEGFGRNSLFKETYNLSMVVFGDQKKVNNTSVDINYRVSQELKQLIPTVFTRTQLTTLDCLTGIIRATNVQLDKKSVHSSELPESEYKIKPSNILFSVNYTVDISFMNECFNYSCPVTEPSTDSSCTGSPVTIYDLNGAVVTTVQAGGSYTIPCGLLSDPDGQQLYAD